VGPREGAADGRSGTVPVVRGPSGIGRRKAQAGAKSQA